MTVTIYGIKNCDTMKKAFKWLDAHNVEYAFHDYKKEGIDENAITEAINENGWENVINRRGTTWRKLPDDIKESMNDKNALKIANENPSIVKRPLLAHKKKYHLGFKDELYSQIFKK